MDDKELTRRIIAYAMKVHSGLGPGLLESAYKECLWYELIANGLTVEKEKALPLIYKDIRMDCGYRIDLLVEGRIVVEVKSVDCFSEIHFAQVLTYLRLSGNRIALMINFNVVHQRDGIKRIVNGY